ncbi:MerR family transcriptional regulator [Brevibacillus migulae]|uniref:MerR family transcriptional regulator n=1 Tax=Brevibacillus migulae TaxID=1644114 RepID=UPI00106E41A3|nr:MerR family transcriptional regulator [Brevibacillus migulae]
MKLVYSIREASEKSGISSYTLRYYEKIGLLPPAKRNSGGRRTYTDGDLKFLAFLKSLKETGMSLDEINEIVQDGCIMEQISMEVEMSQLTPSLHKRIDILTRHLQNMEAKKLELEQVISATMQKLDTYHSILAKDVDKK